MARQVEIFTAGCPLCDEAVTLVNELACPSCEVTVYDLREQGDALAQAKRYGVAAVPTVVVDGKIADCCVRPGVNAETLKATGIGQPL